MRIFILISLLILSYEIKAQSEIINHRRVLVSDSGDVYGKKFTALAYSGSYFVCAHQYSNAFSNQEFNDFKTAMQNFNSEIAVHKSTDNKGLVCIFPKIAIR